MNKPLIPRRSGQWPRKNAAVDQIHRSKPFAADDRSYGAPVTGSKKRATEVARKEHTTNQNLDWIFNPATSASSTWFTPPGCLMYCTLGRTVSQLVTWKP